MAFPNSQANPAAAIPVWLAPQPPGAAARTTYQAIEASAANRVLGVTGAVGDLLNGFIIIPATTSPGALTIGDGVAPNIILFAGGVGSVNNLVFLPLPLGIYSAVGSWRVTLGSNMSALAVGSFS